jgi:hypothetical protein
MTFQFPRQAVVNSATGPPARSRRASVSSIACRISSLLRSAKVAVNCPVFARHCYDGQRRTLKRRLEKRMPNARIIVIIVASAATLAAIACSGDGADGPLPTPGITTLAQTQVAGIVTPFPTPVVTGSSVDSSASKGYSALFPEGWNFYPNRIQTRDASADVAFEPLKAGATAQASIVVNCIARKAPSPGEHITFEATKVAQIGTNSQIQTSTRTIAGIEATVVSYHFESPNEANIPPLEKQDILFSSRNCDWILTTTTPAGQRAAYEPLFNAFLDSFRVTG